MVFMGVILKTTPGARKAHNICHRITRRLYLWESSQNAALCAGIVKENQLQPARKKGGNEETEASTFIMKVVNVNIRAVVRGIRGQGKIGVLFPGDTKTKTVRLVMEVLREKHPVMHILDLTNI